MNMKFKPILSLLLIASLLSTLVIHADTATAKDGMRGMWVASVLNIDYPTKPTTNPDTLKTEAVNALNKAQSLGLNAVFLQVRPASDALYDSRYFPWSKYLTGSQGVSPENGFDPLAFWVEEAHKRGIQLHAWINPYRITKKTAAEPAQDLKQLAPFHPARLHPEWTVKHTDGNFYFNPGIPEVRQLVIDSALELITRYGVDGIHFDDYFYPGKIFDDAATFAKYGKGFTSRDDWRRDNVNTLVRDLSKAIKAESSTARFGISPFGIWANRSTNPMGSDTNGMQSYYDHYADSLAWIKAGTIDYIAPQLYWNIGYKAADYSKLTDWWKNAVTGTGVDLYIGHGAYRSGNSDTASPWYGTSEIEKQLRLNAQHSEIKGSIFYNYKALSGNALLGNAIRQWCAQGKPAAVIKSDIIAPAVQLSVSRPSENTKTALTQFYLNGSSNIGMPLLLNGVPVENRSKSGFFGVLVPLSPGVNTFTLTQGTSAVTRIITRTTGTAAAPVMKSVEIPAGSVVPQKQEYRAPGDKITLSCEAPIGSAVTVKLGGKSYPMKPGTTKSPGKGLYGTTFTYTYTLPAYSGNPRVVELGAPVYSLNYKGTVKSRKAPASVGVIMKNSLLHAIATQDVINTYNTPTTSNGASNELYNGMVDTVTAMTGNYIHLSSGKWVNRSGVRTYTTTKALNPTVKNTEYVTGAEWDTLVIDLTSPVASTAVMDGNMLKISIALAKTGPLPALPWNSLFSTVRILPKENSLEYHLTLKENQRIDGYALDKTKTGIIVKIKRPVRTLGGGLPLSGMTIMLDPGHGGSDPGAIGPLGTAYPEKTINLDNGLALKSELERNGASVLMTRMSDMDLSLDQRLTLSRNAKPDLFISLHANSMDHNVDISKISGFSAYYRESFARTLTQTIHDTVVQTLQRNSKGIHANNFYITRGTWTPSILLETGFVPNPGEFELLIDKGEQSRLAVSITGAIVTYFSK